jgi:hypothetical protein
MNFEIRRFALYKEMIVRDGGTTLETGFLDDEERKALADKLREAADELDPKEA